jgi:phage gpG-like protein
MNLNINVTGYKETNEALKNIRDEFRDFSEPLIKSGGYYLEEIEENFNSEGNKFGNGWAPLADRTIKEKIELFSKGKAIAISKPLIRTGWLKNSFFYDFLSKSKIMIHSLADPYVVNLMHFGGINKEGYKVPARTIMKVDDERTNKVFDIFSEWVDKIINKHIK